MPFLLMAWGLVNLLEVQWLIDIAPSGDTKEWLIKHSNTMFLGGIISEVAIIHKGVIQAANYETDVIDIQKKAYNNQINVDSLNIEMKAIKLAFQHLNIQDAHKSLALLKKAYDTAIEFQNRATDRESQLFADNILQEITTMIQLLNADGPGNEEVASMITTTNGKIERIAS